MVVTSGGNGPCRAGHYGELSERIMRSIGKDIEVIVFDSIYQKPIDFIKKVNRVNSARLSPLSIIQLVRFYWRKLQALDNLERLSHKVRPRELKRDDTTKAFQQGIEWIRKAETLSGVVEAEREGLLVLENVPQDAGRKVVRVGIVGEIYVVLEPAINLEIEEMLGNLGVEVDRSIYLTGWTRANTFGHKDNF
ncbi:hypothetical protein CEB3_c07760 [Peptococcaceae bacterium CEB3]|nr:hypothetical protein CEB3_c07760 [Peptococcaceae bacterium CEB3]